MNVGDAITDGIRAELPPPAPTPHPRPAHVHWIDAHGQDGWLAPADMAGPPRRIHSVCWVLPTAKPEHLTIAQDYDTDADRWNGVTHLPWSMVRRVDYIDAMSYVVDVAD